MTSRVRQATTDNGIAALHLAARQGHLEVVKVLLDFGADKDKAGNTQISAMKYELEVRTIGFNDGWHFGGDFSSS